VKKPAPPSALRRNSSQVDSPTEEDSAAAEAKAAYLQDLEERLLKAETEAEERQKQIEVLNARLDDAHAEQSKLEERAHEEEEKVEALENEKREIIRQHRELEGIYEAERAQAMKDKESTQTREEELQETIQRLKETMATKNVQNVEDGEAPLSRACKFYLSAWTFDTDIVQRASATTLHAQTPHRTLRTSHLLTRFNAATRATTQSSSTRKTRLSKICVSSLQNIRSRCWRLRMLEVVGPASWRSSCLRHA
jgi:flagellar biosynthesis GTPase FlhF